MVDRIAPMLLDDRKQPPFSDPDWLFEVKYDGYRMLAEFGDGQVSMWTRQLQDCTAWFPEVAEALASYRGGRCVVDGEVSVLDELGRSDFNRLQDRARRRRWYAGADPVAFCMFDLLVDRGRDVMALPLVDRKKRLARRFSPKPAQTLLVVDAIPERGEELFRRAVQLQLEGLTAKLATSPYLPGERTAAWRKVKRKGAVFPERFRRSSVEVS